MMILLQPASINLCAALDKAAVRCIALMRQQGQGGAGDVHDAAGERDKTTK